MKKIYLSIFLSIALAGQICLAQTDYNESSLTVKAVFYNFKAPNNDNMQVFSDLDKGLELGYHKQLNKWFSLAVPLRLGSVDFPNYDSNLKQVSSYQSGKVYVGLDILANVHLLNGKVISPFIYGGLGAVAPELKSKDLYAQLPLGLGFSIKLSDRAWIEAQTDYRFAFEDGRDSWQHAIGLKLNLDGRDRDGDGVSDNKDSCPDVPGTVNGCPDADGDGIADKDDKCVNLAGVPENMGCPSDKDRDGVYDTEDECPDVAGTVKGCPDKDGDGFPDKNDKCPDVAGKLMGCPDKDMDGVADKDDKCPDVAGPVSNFGCPPDRDNDGFPDASDPCPDQAGSTNGCPDTDGDGLTDNLDKCPNTPGPASNNGCPEIKKEDQKKLDVAMTAVQFRTGTAILTPASRKVLNDVVKVLSTYPEMNLNIEGHTDDVGDEMKNLKLSLQRANSCKDYLISKGIKEDRLNVVGHGESKPVADNKTNEGRKANRRTEFNPVWR